MSSCYGPLAARYDQLTGDVDYNAFADWYEAAFAERGGAVHAVLDLCCGTGSLSLILARRGYEMICADASAEMLMVFQQKVWELPEEITPPLLLCQRAEELDLYGTVDAAICSLDGFNYMPPAILPEVFRRLHLFVAPGGLLCFDLLSPERLRSMDGQCFVDEGEDLLCLWRASLEEESIRYGMDIFRRSGRHWLREQEEHIEYIHDPADMIRLMEESGFGRISLRTDGPQGREGRLFLLAERL